MENAPKIAFESKLLMAINGWAGRYAALDITARAVAVFGLLLLIAAVAFLTICSSQGWRRWGGCVTLISAVPAYLLVRTMDELFCRPRPFLCHPVRLLLCVADSISFPSFEVGIAAALAFGLFAYGGSIRWVALPCVLLIGLARVFCGIEYPLDQVWAALAGCLATLTTMFLLNPRFIFLKPEGWPVGAVGSFIVLGGILLFMHTPEFSLPPPQSTSRSAAPILSAEEKNLIRGMSPAEERQIANALLRLHLPGRIRKVEVGDGEAISVATVKFDAGMDAKPLARAIIEREALAIIPATLKAAPKLSEVDVFAVTTWNQNGRPALNVAYSVSAQRKDAGFLFPKPPADVSPAKLLARFGLIHYRVQKEAE